MQQWKHIYQTYKGYAMLRYFLELINKNWTKLGDNLFTFW